MNERRGSLRALLVVISLALVPAAPAPAWQAAAKLSRPARPYGALGNLPRPVDAEEPGWAVFLESGALQVQATEGSPARIELPAGSVVELIEEITDTFGRRWSRIRDPFAVERVEQRFLAPFDEATFRGYSGAAAFLEMPPELLAPGSGLLTSAAGTPVPVGPASGAVAGGTRAPSALPQRPARQISGQVPGLALSAPLPPPWWTRVRIVTPAHQPQFRGVVAADARAVSEPVAREVIELLGGLGALGPWPERPVAGQLHVPDALPLLFRSDGRRWELVTPPRYFGEGLGLLANPDLVVDAEAPIEAGGPALPSWILVGALDSRGALVGSVAPALEATLRRGRGAETAVGTSRGTPLTQALTPVAPPTARVPPRLEAITAPGGVVLRDETNQHAVHLEQALPAELVGRLRGAELRLDVVARALPGSTGGATIGVGVETGGVRTFAGGSLGEGPTTMTMSFPVPDDATDVIVRILPVDPSIAVEQHGVIILDRVLLRLATWPETLPPALFVLHEVMATAWEGVPRFTRAALAPSRRPVDELTAIWPRLADSGWPEDDIRRVLAGEVRRGMTPEQVRASWGAPSEVVEGELSGGHVRWDYPDRRSAVFVDGVLVSWTLEPEPGTATHPPPCPEPPC